MIEQSPNEIAEAMVDEPEKWAELFLDQAEQIDNLTRTLELLAEITGYDGGKIH